MDTENDGGVSDFLETLETLEPSTLEELLTSAEGAYNIHRFFSKKFFSEGSSLRGEQALRSSMRSLSEVIFYRIKKIRKNHC